MSRSSRKSLERTTQCQLTVDHRGRAVWAAVVLLLGAVLAACGSEDDSGRTFAPEVRGDTGIPTSTPFPTSTAPPLNRQPGETTSGAERAGELFAQTGPAEAIISGLTRVNIVSVKDGESDELDIPRSSSILASASPDGDRCIVIDRTGGQIAVRMYLRDGSVVAEWSPQADATPQPGTPAASPPARPAEIQVGDLIVWSPDGAKAIVSIGGDGAFVTNSELKMAGVPASKTFPVTAVTWSPSGQSIALGIWDGVRGSAGIVTVEADAVDSPGTNVFSLAERDGRFIRSLAWGSEQVGLVFALRAAGANFSLPNDLYHLPRFGEPMRLLASAGIAAPAAVVDLIAVAGNGSTIAFTVLVPGDVGIRFHSVWVTDALAPAPSRANTTGIRRVTDIEWSADGLNIAGLRRSQSEVATYQVAIVERISESEPQEISADRSAATPVASPQDIPVEASPE